MGEKQFQMVEFNYDKCSNYELINSNVSIHFWENKQKFNINININLVLIFFIMKIIKGLNLKT